MTDQELITPWEKLPYPVAEYYNGKTHFWEICKIVSFVSDSGLKETLNYWLIINKFGELKTIYNHKNVRFSKLQAE
jgi:hypothetical protein